MRLYQGTLEVPSELSEDQLSTNFLRKMCKEEDKGTATVTGNCISVSG